MGEEGRGAGQEAALQDGRGSTTQQDGGPQQRWCSPVHKLLLCMEDYQTHVACTGQHGAGGWLVLGALQLVAVTLPRRLPSGALRCQAASMPPWQRLPCTGTCTSARHSHHVRPAATRRLPAQVPPAGAMQHAGPVAAACSLLWGDD
jgi:uncharacterized protein (TIGR03382 family)